MSEEEKPVHIPFHAKDHASSVIHKIAHAAEHLGHTVDHTIAHLTEMGAAIAGVSGAFGFERMVETGKESLEQIAKLSKLTGTSADNVAAFRDAFEGAGLGADQFARSMSMLSKKALALDENGKAISAEARRWGVDLKHGPVEALLSISRQVEKHKIGQAEVMKLTGVTKENLGGMMHLLEEGPRELQETLEHARKLNVHLKDPGALEQFQKFHKASVQVHEAWRRVSERVVISLAPALEKMANKVSDWINKIDVDKFVGRLTKGLEFAVDHARELGRIMLINAALQRTGAGGIVGGIGKAWGASGRVLGMGGKALGLAEKIPGIGQATGAIGKLFSGFKSLGPLLSILGRLTIVTAIAGAVYALSQHSERFRAILGSIIAHVTKIGSALWNAFGPLIEKVSSGMLWVLDKWLSVIEKIAGLLERLFGESENYVSESATMIEKMRTLTSLANNGPAGYTQGAMFAQRFAAQSGVYIPGAATAFSTFAPLLTSLSGTVGDMRKATSALGRSVVERKTPEKPTMVQDFRGSRFEIEQKFAEGFDPDRIAVAFASDLASMGEKRFTSGLTPAFSIR